MERMKKPLLLAMVVCLFACALALPRKMPPVTGQVLDQDTGQPVEGAIVVMRWQGTATMAFVDQRTLCYHVETAISDADGRFSTPAWIEASRYRNLGLKKRMETVYKAGYRHVRSEGNLHYLVLDRGDVEEKLSYLENLVRNSGCYSAGKLMRRSYPMLEAVFYEAKELGASQELLQWMRYVVASAWLAHDGPIPSRVHNREISIFLRDHLL